MNKKEKIFIGALLLGAIIVLCIIYFLIEESLIKYFPNFPN